ncbi:TauD/TfdA family dioxygenase [Psychrobacter sp. JB385]|uniref:TauD/TfdA family dioxygenase n=1 Tax=Psychrobacter sp. JB385 TaxID=1434841 RepID=UPI00097E99CE|nr:TauD/TfdA family dioxygenase [Psychrobacter sp. JB385]SJN24381.1 Gll1897 protein [Psychrobacter sp. JB385]
MKTTLMAHNAMSHDPLSSNHLNDNDAKTVIFPSSMTPPLSDTSDILTALRTQGWILLRGQHYDVETFSQLMRQLCQTLTYDPARQNITSEAQKVDAGTHAIGLHIENGNTPMPPDIIAFFSELSAKKGSQTTICDGYAVYQALSPELKALFSQPMRISRYLPQAIWQNYVATATGRANADQISLDDLDTFITATTSKTLMHYVEPQADDGVRYVLQIPAIRADNLSGQPAFANTLLGPSFNYEKPEFTLADGQSVDEAMVAELTQICEKHTQEVHWQNGDVVILDNKRIMHGRRQIEVPLAERKLYIAMGLGIKDSDD